MFNLSFGAEEASAWYQAGNWPLLGALGTLIISNIVAFGAIVFQQRSSHKNAIELQSIEFIGRQLEQFYNPILALLMENRVVFENLGPPSFPTDDDSAAEAAIEFWSNIRDEFVIPNNEKISAIIQSKSHLISNLDSLNHYMKLKLHIDAYTTFQVIRAERYVSFSFPVGIERTVETHRNRLIDDLGRIRRK